MSIPSPARTTSLLGLHDAVARITRLLERRAATELPGEPSEVSPSPAVPGSWLL